MKRTPFYHRDNAREYRVVYRPSNRWVAQRNDGSQATREHDPWQDLHSPCESFEHAREVMYQRHPLKP
jgi:hypothetical protein